MWLEEVKKKAKRKNLILFSKDNILMQELSVAMTGVNRRVLILWALNLATETVHQLEEKYPEDARLGNALETAWTWASGEIKTPIAKRAILECHGMAKELTDAADIARCHAVAQACSVIHTEGHALGYPMYDLTVIVLEKGIGNCRTSVEDRMEHYLERLRYWKEQEPQYSDQWAQFLRRARK